MYGAIDIAVIGAGAAGLMAAISAGRASKRRADCPPAVRIVAFDGAEKLGAKILVSGGGRCNVTHHAVDASAFNGSTSAAIRKVLARFDVPRVTAFFLERGVTLKREDTGKLFPTTNRARTILDALLTAATDVGVELRHPARVEAIEVIDDLPERLFRLNGPFGRAEARRVILATGGRSLPKTGSDGWSYELVRGLGHTTTERILPALVPLVLDDHCFVRGLAGVTLPTRLSVRSVTGRRIAESEGSTLCTHFGLSGPSVLDISRHYLHAVQADSQARLHVNWLPEFTPESLDSWLIEQAATAGRTTIGALLSRRLPSRLADALCREAHIDPTIQLSALARPARTALVHIVTDYVAPVVGDRGFAYAEVTAGGVPLRELHLDTMESRPCPGLYLCGEICDVDGRIGGFNFQWAWASGHVAGVSAAASLSEDDES